MTVISRRVELAIRSGVTPLILGMRWGGAGAARPEVAGPALPVARRGFSVGCKAAIDELFMAIELATGRLVSGPDRRRLARELSQAISLYAARNWFERPARYHVEPPPIECRRIVEDRSLWTRYLHLRFQSEYEPHVGEPGRTRWLDYRGNRTAHAWLLQHQDKPRPWLVCVPGYRMGHPAVDLTGFHAQWLHKTLGLNLAIPVLPFHGPRRAHGRTGDGFLTGDFIDTLHAQAQAVWDVRRIIRWLRRCTGGPIGLYGISLGAYTSALVASLEEELACVIAGVPPTDFARLLRGHLPPVVLRGAKRIGIHLERVEQVLHVVSPLAMQPRLPHGRRFLYAGLADAVAPFDHAHDLWEHWDRPRADFYHGSHVSFVWEPSVRKLIHGALVASGLVEAPRPELV